MRSLWSRSRLYRLVGLVLAAIPLSSSPEALATDTSPTAQAPAARWNTAVAAELIEIVAAAREEGLDPAVYGLADLRNKATEPGPELDLLADRAASQLAHDYYLGRVADRSGMQWMIQRDAGETQKLAQGLQDALAHNSLRDFFASLLPSDPRYGALRQALATATDHIERDRLRANMERWRWMPRTLPPDYLYINIPSYTLQLFEGGIALSSYDVIVGARATPTPQMVSPMDSLVVNPAWYVPDSIVRKSALRAGRDGYVWKATVDGGRRLVQMPGPTNALGRLKFNLANNQSIYLHDTNAPRAFNRDVRALSHGCIRVKDIDQLAVELMSRGGDAGRLEVALAGSDTATMRLPRSWPVLIVYFTADSDGGSIVKYGDPYGYDARILAELDREPVRIASR